MRIPAFICAVSQSTVFPRRSLLSLCGKSLLACIAERLSGCSRVDQIVLCTSDMAGDDELAAHAGGLGLTVVRGSQADVRARLVLAFEQTHAARAFVVRGDTPLVDMAAGEKLLDLHVTKDADFSYNEHTFGLPYGLGCEVLEARALARMERLRPAGIYSEKIAHFIRLHDDQFAIAKADFDTPNPDARFVVEMPADYEFLSELVGITGLAATTPLLLEALRKHPYLARINRGVAPATEIGLGKLVLFPEKLGGMVRGGLDDTYPVSVELSLTNDCNLRCHWCSDRGLRTRYPGSLPFENYVSLVHDLAGHGTRGLVIEGGGEPTLYPRFRDAIETALDAKLAVGLITNGVVFNYEDLLPRLEWVRVSLDADSAGTFARIKGYDGFTQVLGNIRRMCAKRGDCVVGVGYVVSKDNIAHLEDIVMLLVEYGANYLHLRPVIDHPEFKATTDVLHLKKFETDSLAVMIHAMEENTISGNGGVPCVAHGLSTVIAADGSLFLCGRLNVHDWVPPIGNICRQSFHEIWAGPVRRQQAAQVADPAFCRKWCPECRLTKFNLILDAARKVKTRNFI